MMGGKKIVTTADELRALMGEIVEPLRAELANLRPSTPPAVQKRMSPEQAARFLTDQGHPTTRATIYDLVYRRAIPYAKVGHRVVLFRHELLEWLESRTNRPRWCEARTSADQFQARLNKLGKSMGITLTFERDANGCCIRINNRPNVLALGRGPVEMDAYIDGLRDMYLLMKFGNVPE